MNENRKRCTFEDAAKNEYRLKINIGKIKTVRQEVTDKEGRTVDLLEFVNDNLAYRLFTDTVLFGEVLWILCKDEAKEFTKEAFLSLIWGDCLQDAEEAFVEAFVDFFPLPQQGLVLKVAETAQKFRETIRQLQRERVELEIQNQQKIQQENSGT